MLIKQSYLYEMYLLNMPNINNFLSISISSLFFISTNFVVVQQRKTNTGSSNLIYPTINNSPDVKLSKIFHTKLDQTQSYSYSLTNQNPLLVTYTTFTNTQDFIDFKTQNYPKPIHFLPL